MNPEPMLIGPGDTFSGRYAADIASFKESFRKEKEALRDSIRFGIWKRVEDAGEPNRTVSISFAADVCLSS